MGFMQATHSRTHQDTFKEHRPTFKEYLRYTQADNQYMDEEMPRMQHCGNAFMEKTP